MSKLRYCCSIYGSTTETRIDRLQKIQNKTIKVLFASNLKTDEIYKAHKITSIKQMVEYQIITQNYFKQTHKKQIVRATRNCKEWLVVPISRNSYGKRNQGYMIPHIFNKILTYLRSLNGISSENGNKKVDFNLIYLVVINH